MTMSWLFVTLEHGFEEPLANDYVETNSEECTRESALHARRHRLPSGGFEIYLSLVVILRLRALRARISLVSPV